MNSARLILITVLFVLGNALMPISLQAQTNELIGRVDAEEILEADRIFQIYAERYEPEKEALSYLKAYEDSVEVWVFFGTWCRESKKYIPGLVKTEQLANANSIAFQYVGVGPQKKIPKALLKKFEIKYIPTVVVLKGPKELGRIVEKPLQTIETDLVEILKMSARKN